MCIFLGGFDILIILFMIFACITWGVETIGKLLPYLFVIFLAKNIVQDIVFGFWKNHKKLLSILFFLLIDLSRVLIFFYTANLCVKVYSLGGMAYVDGIFGLLIYIIVGGFIFVLGEICSMLHGLETNVNYRVIFVVDICILILLVSFSAFIYW